jgi:hypothetical protein
VSGSFLSLGGVESSVSSQVGWMVCKTNNDLKRKVIIDCIRTAQYEQISTAYSRFISEIHKLD